MIWIFLWYDATCYSDFDKTSLLKVEDFRTRVSRCCKRTPFHQSPWQFYNTSTQPTSCALKLRYPSWYIPTTIALVVQRVPSSDVGDRCMQSQRPPRASWKHQWNRKLTSFVQQIFCHLLCGEVCMCNINWYIYIPHICCAVLVCIALLLHSYIYHQTLLETFWNLTLLKQPPCDTVVTVMTWHSIQCRNAHSDSDTTLAISCAIAVLCRRQVQKSASCRGGAKSEFRQNTTHGESFRIID